MRFIVCAFLCLLLLIPAAFAQSDRGTITGTVTDPAGAMIPNAAIEAKNTQTGVVFNTVSSATGNYTLSQLPVGIYQLSATVTGFKQYVRTGITVMVAQTLRLDIPLEVGSISETVTVSADAPLLKTESGELSHNVTTDRINELPLISVGGGIRSSYAQVNLIPGAATMAGGFGTLRVNGMPGATLALRIEGQDATQTAWTTAYGMSQAGVDSIEETAIQTSNFAAEFGQAGGGVFNMTMRSGTNKLHGSAYEYWRNEAFNAYAPFNKPAVKPRDRRHDFGFTAGAPVYIPKVYDGRDKTFLFWTYETNRQNTTVTNRWTVPTLAYRAGDFSSPALYTQKVLGTDPLGRPILDGAIYDPRTTRTVTGTDGKSYVVRDQFKGCDGNTPNVICQDPSKPAYFAFDPVSLNYQKQIPAPNLSGTTSNYEVTYPNKPVTSIHSVKADHQISSKMKISGYWSLNDVTIFFPDGYKTPITTERDLYETTHTVRISFDYTISPTVLMHLGAGVMHFKFDDPAPGYGTYDAQKELGLPGTYLDVAPTVYNLYQGQGGGMQSTSGQGNSFGPVAQQTQYQTKPTSTATLSWVKNNHTFKFGAEMRIESYPSTAGTPSNGWFYFNGAQTALPYLGTTNPTGGTLGFPYASFLLGYVNNGEIGQYSKFHLGKQAWGFFAQDSWKITPKLTLDYGLRYDYQTYLRETYGRIPSFGYQTPNPKYGNIPGAVIYETNGVKFAKNYPWAFGPRLGLAWQFMPKTVLRAGIGISYGQTANLEMWSLRFGSDERYNVSTFGGTEIQFKNGPPIVPVWPNTDPGSQPQTPGAVFMTSFDSNAGRPPRQVMWSLGIQREITRNLSLDVSYVGNRGVWWNSNGALTDPNRVTPAILAAHNLSLSNSSHLALLTTPLSAVSAADKAAYNLKDPYTGFAGTVSQSLRPYPHFGGIFVLWAPLGNTWYDSLQMKLTKRFSQGLDFTAAYTYQKELTVGAETFDPAFAPVNPAINDLNDMRSNKTISGLSVPHRLVFAANYTTPSPNWSKPVDMILRNWQIGAVVTYQSATPIHVPFAQNNIAYQLSLCAPQSVFGGCNSSPYYNAQASHMNRVAGQPLFTTDLNSKFDPYKEFVLNPAAWSNPAPGTFGTTSAYLNDYRYRRQQNENLSLARIFRVREGMNLSIRMELMNAFNRVRIPNPSSDNALAPQVRNPVTGNTQSGFGYINPFPAGGQRTGQFVARFMF
jgi:hypothetical protein